MRVVKRYSQAFKLQVISEIESGTFYCLEEARKYYGITGQQTIKRWINQFGKNHLMPKVVRIETVNEKNQIDALKKKIKLLEKALADTRLDQIVAESYFEAFCDEFGVTDYEALKKKLDMKRLKKQ